MRPTGGRSSGRRRAGLSRFPKSEACIIDTFDERPDPTPPGPGPPSLLPPGRRFPRCDPRRDGAGPMGGGMLTALLRTDAHQSPGVLVLSQEDGSSPSDSNAVLAKDRLAGHLLAHPLVAPPADREHRSAMDELQAL